MMKMSAEAAALAQVLLDQHRRICRPPGGPPADLDSGLITYRTLCDKADVPFLTRTVGHFLQQVAEWCQTNGWLPINSLAVNHETRMPGDGYGGAPGCSILRWPSEVQACRAFHGYPDRVSR